MDYLGLANFIVHGKGSLDDFDCGYQADEGLTVAEEKGTDAEVEEY